MHRRTSSRAESRLLHESKTGGDGSVSSSDSPAEDIRRRFGFTDDEWRRMVDAGYRYLTARAAIGQISDYTTVAHEVARVAGVEVKAWEYGFHWVLGDIATKSYREDDVLLTAVVTYRNSTEGRRRPLQHRAGSRGDRRDSQGEFDGARSSPYGVGARVFRRLWRQGMSDYQRT